MNKEELKNYGDLILKNIEEQVKHDMRLKKEIEDLNNRIDKAIEYIRSEYTITDDDVYLALYSSDGTLGKLENILKGEE